MKARFLKILFISLGSIIFIGNSVFAGSLINYWDEKNPNSYRIKNENEDLKYSRSSQILNRDSHRKIRGGFEEILSLLPRSALNELVKIIDQEKDEEKKRSKRD